MREPAVKDMTRILVVEDSPTQAEWLKLILDEAGFVAEIRSRWRDGSCVPRRIVLRHGDLRYRHAGPVGLRAFCRKIKADPALRSKFPSFCSRPGKTRRTYSGASIAAPTNFYTKPYDPDRLVGRIRNILSNRALRLRVKREDGVEVSFSGQTFIVDSGKEQILDLLVSTFEDIVLANLDLEKSRNELVAAKAAVEEYARLLESRARSSEEVHRTIVEGISEGIITMDEQGNHQLHQSGGRRDFRLRSP